MAARRGNGMLANVQWLTSTLAWWKTAWRGAGARRLMRDGRNASGVAW